MVVKVRNFQNPFIVLIFSALSKMLLITTAFLNSEIIKTVGGKFPNFFTRGSVDSWKIRDLKRMKV